MTDRQQQVLDLVTKGERDVAKMAKHLGISKPGVYGHLRALKEQGVTLPAEFGQVGERKITSRKRRSTKQRATRSAPAAQTTTNGRLDIPAAIEATLRSQRAAIQDRRQTIAQEIRQVRESVEQQVAALRAEDESLGEDMRRLQAIEKAATEPLPVKAPPAKRRTRTRAKAKA